MKSSFDFFNVLRAPAAADAVLTDSGLDSLAVSELRNMLQQELGEVRVMGHWVTRVYGRVRRGNSTK